MLQNTTPGDLDRAGDSLDEIRNRFANCLNELRPHLITFGYHRYGLERDDAEDCVQDVWERCERNADILIQVNKPESWLRQTFDFSCRTRRALIQKRLARSLDADDDTEAGHDTNTSASLDTMLFKLGLHDGPRTSNDYNIQEYNALLWDAVSALSHREKLAVIFRIVTSCSYEEIASRMGCTEATARVHIHKALPKMRKFIEMHKHQY